MTDVGLGADYFNRKPTTRKQVSAWVKAFLGVTISDHCRCLPDEGRPHTSQLDYVSAAFFNEYSSCVNMACRNGGKSMMGAVVCILDALFKAGIKIAVTAFTREQADFIRIKIIELLATLKAKTGKTVAAVKKDIMNFSSGSVIRFFSGAKSDANVTGWRPNVLILDEAVDGVANCLEGGGTIPSRFDILSTNYTLSGDGVVLKMIERYEQFNKTKFDHMLPARIFVSCLLDVLVECDDRFHCDSCALFPYCRGAAKQGGGGYFRIEEAINKLIQNSKPSFEAEYMLWRPSSEISYFTNFSITQNVVDHIEYDPTKETFIAVDPGGDRCAHGAVIIQRTKPKDRNDITTYYVVDEFVQQCQFEIFLDRIKAKYPRILDAQCFYDPAGNRKEAMMNSISFAGLLRKAGFYPRCRQFKRRQGFELISNLIAPASGPPKLIIAKRCTNLIKQIQAAEHETVKGKPIPEPADITPDEAIDCLRYIISWTCGTYAKNNGTNKILHYFNPR
jgi:hypothetical protein